MYIKISTWFYASEVTPVFMGLSPNGIINITVHIVVINSLPGVVASH